MLSLRRLKWDRLNVVSSEAEMGLASMLSLRRLKWGCLNVVSPEAEMGLELSLCPRPAYACLTTIL